MDQAENQAIAACQAGELSHFTLLYERYVERVYRFVYFKTWHKPTAEDITSLTFLKALENIARFDPARGRFSSWLYRIAQNTVIDHYRAAKPEVNIDEIFSLAARQDIAATTEVNRALEEVESYLKNLEPETRDLLIMRLWQGLSYEEIAELTGKSQGSLKMAASRALRQLRTSVSPLALLLILVGLR